MNNRLQNDPLARAVRIGEDVYAALRSFSEVVVDIPPRLHNIQVTVNSIVASLKDMDVSMRRPQGQPKPEDIIQPRIGANPRCPSSAPQRFQIVYTVIFFKAATGDGRVKRSWHLRHAEGVGSIRKINGCHGRLVS